MHGPLIADWIAENGWYVVAGAVGIGIIWRLDRIYDEMKRSNQQREAERGAQASQPEPPPRPRYPPAPGNPQPDRPPSRFAALRQQWNEWWDEPRPR